MRILSWNLLRRVGATAEDVAGLVRLVLPDIALFQEATEEIAVITSLAGGHFVLRRLPNRIHGLAAWSRQPLTEPDYLPLPFDPKIPSGDRRIAMLLPFGGVSIANVHLSHGQGLLRRQVRHIAGVIRGAGVIVGDMNVVGPIFLPDWRDVGPWRPTHRAGGVIPVRLDRCMVRGVGCSGSIVLPNGRSDHNPILMELDTAAVVLEHQMSSEM